MDIKLRVAVCLDFGQVIRPFPFLQPHKTLVLFEAPWFTLWSRLFSCRKTGFFSILLCKVDLFQQCWKYLLLPHTILRVHQGPCWWLATSATPGAALQSNEYAGPFASVQSFLWRSWQRGLVLMKEETLTRWRLHVALPPVSLDCPWPRLTSIPYAEEDPYFQSTRWLIFRVD